MDDDLQELRLAWDDHYNLPFPEVPDTGDSALDSALVDIYGELALYDGHIAGLLQRIVDGARTIPFPLEKDEELRAKLNSVISSGSSEEIVYAKKYLSYLDSIERIIDIASPRVEAVRNPIRRRIEIGPVRIRQARVIPLEGLLVDEGLQELQHAWSEFYDRPFPPPPSRDNTPLADICTELVMYDGDTAGLMMRILQGARTIPYPLDKNEGLRERLSSVISSSSPEEVDDARKYLARLDEIHRLIDMASPRVEAVRNPIRRRLEVGPVWIRRRRGA
ncbi:MAG: hypothetical protein M3P51_14725 [Chloroflexota bacterium]|nr:hypothetical protein [Chloroflexota bacterium]